MTRTLIIYTQHFLLFSLAPLHILKLRLSEDYRIMSGRGSAMMSFGGENAVLDKCLGDF
jgi:hypothetical protein